MTVLGGTEGVCAAIKAQIDSKLVDELRQIEQERGFGQGTLSVSPEGGNGPTRSTGLVPRLVTPVDRPELDLNQYPAILIEAEGVPISRFSQVIEPAHYPDSDEMLDGDLYTRIYNVRLSVHVMGVGWEETRLNRDRLEYALWRCLTRTRVVGTDIAIEQNTLTSSYLDVTAADAGKMQSGFRMRLSVRVDELISLAPDAVADIVEADVERL